MKAKKNLVLGIVLVLLFSLVACGQKTIEEELSIDLVSCISSSRSDSENSLYEINDSYLTNLGLTKSDTKHCAISMDTGSKAYCVAIIETNDKENVSKKLEDYSANRAAELYVQYYDESLIAEKSVIRYLKDYIIFVMGPNAETTCDSIENSLIIAMG